ncbi:uncharacterized protein BJ171DRAFT_597855 [Polychytrium aggregatum]|uniref:uncharacterized protein n=1 Tax=Polychytrium aggregatum TaxID=110093 RepID=UPI0022FECD8C|nr:uncharacterized protein BJ171DRAFT_597855 [Polychytrium aggregatum]KAI9206185.1 hypothetical protein BJ171DRAFT_597855 [Polychytrium aggregatum]
MSLQRNARRCDSKLSLSESILAPHGYACFSDSVDRETHPLSSLGTPVFVRQSHLQELYYSYTLAQHTAKGPTRLEIFLTAYQSEVNRIARCMLSQHEFIAEHISSIVKSIPEMVQLPRTSNVLARGQVYRMRAFLSEYRSQRAMSAISRRPPSEDVFVVYLQSLDAVLKPLSRFPRLVTAGTEIMALDAQIFYFRRNFEAALTELGSIHAGNMVHELQPILHAIEAEQAQLQTYHKSLAEAFESIFTANMEAENYSCPICLSILYRPTETPCGHHFCEACLSKHQLAAIAVAWEYDHQYLDPGYPCPVCRSKFDDCSRVDPDFDAFVRANFPSEYREKKWETWRSEQTLRIRETFGVYRRKLVWRYMLWRNKRL